jgi:hypothetical protein
MSRYFCFTNCHFVDLGLSTILFSKKLGRELTLLNVCGPYAKRLDLWEICFHLKWISHGNIVLRGI